MVLLWGKIRWVSCGEDGFEIERVTWVADGAECGERWVEYIGLA